MLQVNRLEGRLMLVRVVSPVTLGEIDAADKLMSEAEAQAQGKVLIAADYRATKLLNQTESAALLAMFRRHNDNIERSSVLVSDESAIAVLQMTRVIRDANLPTRRAFKDPAELVRWLGESATEAEKKRLAEAFSR